MDRVAVQAGIRPLFLALEKTGGKENWIMKYAHYKRKQNNEHAYYRKNDDFI